MSSIKHLQLVLPQALTQLRAHGNVEQSNSILCDWLRVGERYRLWAADDLRYARLDPWQHALLETLKPELRSHGLASGILHWRGDGGEWRNGTVLHVELVHLQAGMDDLRMLFPPPPTADEASQLLNSLQPLLSVAGFELQPSPVENSGRWYLRSERNLSLTSYSPRAGFANRLYDIMPQGDDGAELRRLMTEAQMLLHEHPVNEARVHRGVPGFNALWFWGATPLELVSQVAEQRVLSNEAYVQGLCEHLHVPCWPLPPDAHALLSIDAQQMLVALSDDAFASLEANWLQPLQAALQRGEIEKLDLHLDHWRISLRGGRWQQFKRRFAAPKQTLADILA